MPEPLKQSPLEILNHVFDEVSLKANPSETEHGPAKVEAKRMLAGHKDDIRNKMLTLSVIVASSDPSQPSSYEATCVVRGYFQVAESFPEEKIDSLVRITGASILYGACREMLANLTARSSHGMISLPSISFIEASAPEKKTAKKKAPAKKSAKRIK